MFDGPYRRFQLLALAFHHDFDVRYVIAVERFFELLDIERSERQDEEMFVRFEMIREMLAKVKELRAQAKLPPTVIEPDKPTIVDDEEETLDPYDAEVVFFGEEAA